MATETPPDESAPRSNAIHVLVVDDSEFFAEMTAETLANEHDMVTRDVNDVDEAKAYLSDTRVDCIVSDYEMPSEDGLAFLEWVHDNFDALPFILLTGRGDEEIASEAIAGGVADYLLKLEVVSTATIHADRSQFQELLEKLVANAIEHAGPDITVEVGVLDGGFYVADDGPGIDPSARETVFELGYSTNAAGTGMGLAIVEQIADAHDWSATVTDSESGGARFEFTDVDSS